MSLQVKVFGSPAFWPDSKALRQREAEALNAGRRAAAAEARLAEKDPRQVLACMFNWVAVKELSLSYHNMDI